MTKKLIKNTQCANCKRLRHAVMGKAIKVFMTHLSYDILWTTSVQFFMTCQSSSRLTKNKNIKFFPLFTLSTVDENHFKVSFYILVHFGKQTV